MARVDLEGTLFKFKSGEKVMEVASSDGVDLSKVRLDIDRDALIKKYQFVWDYAPIMWLDERPDDGFLRDKGWFPSTLEYFLDNVKGESTKNGTLRLTTREPLEDPYDTQDWMHGQEPVDGAGVPVQTIIYPLDAEKDGNDPVEMILNPDKFKTTAVYIYFFPYDWVKYHLGDHVGDLEHTTLYFDGGAPFSIKVSEHDWDTTKDWDDSGVEKEGNHPVVYNASGTHATYFTKGMQWYDVALCDLTDDKVRWDLYKNLDVMFPFDWLSEDRVIKGTGTNLDGINYMLQVEKWGNRGEGFSVAGEEQRVNGPSGFLDKDTENIEQLTRLGYTCEGVDTERCVWPAGVFSQSFKHGTLCSPGYNYSYQLGQCFQAVFDTSGCDMWKECSVKPLEPSEKDPEPSDPCGEAYESYCSGHTLTASCQGWCRLKKLESVEELEFEHFICLDGAWVNAKEWPED